MTSSDPFPSVVLDNGAHTLKAGFASEGIPREVPNAVMKMKGSRALYVGDAIEQASGRSGVYFDSPFEAGYLTQFDVERTIWNRVLGKTDGLAVKPSEQMLVVTEPELNFRRCRETMDEAVFEEYGFAAYYRATGPDYIQRQLYTPQSPGCLVVDSGHSFTHVVPFYGGKRLSEGVRRVDVGGQLLTNQLKELISYRHLDVSEETFVVGQVKEDVCFVSSNFTKDLRACDVRRPVDNPHICEYVLPDFNTVQRGYIRPREEMLESLKQRKRSKGAAAGNSDKQTLRLSNERFSVPELLFTPANVGIEQRGVAHAIVEAVEAVHPDLHAALYANVALVGGNTLIPGYCERVLSELNSLVPDVFGNVALNVVTSKSEDNPRAPIIHAWHAAAAHARNGALAGVTRAEYEEHGVRICAQRFGDEYAPP
eukprot:UC1_evm5s1739